MNNKNIKTKLENCIFVSMIIIDDEGNTIVDMNSVSCHKGLCINRYDRYNTSKNEKNTCIIVIKYIENNSIKTILLNEFNIDVHDYLFYLSLNVDKEEIDSKYNTIPLSFRHHDKNVDHFAVHYDGGFSDYEYYVNVSFNVFNLMTKSTRKYNEDLDFKIKIKDKQYSFHKKSLEKSTINRLKLKLFYLGVIIAKLATDIKRLPSDYNGNYELEYKDENITKTCILNGSDRKKYLLPHDFFSMRSYIIRNMLALRDNIIEIFKYKVMLYDNKNMNRYTLKLFKFIKT